MKDQLLAKIEAQASEDSEAPPVVTLDEYFAGNECEDCIAPNQVGDGRPPIADLYLAFKRIQERSDVQAVLVGIHPDWTEALDDPEAWPAAENVHFYTSATREEVESWIDGLAADGVIDGWPYGMHPSAPPLQSGNDVFTVCWS